MRIKQDYKLMVEAARAAVARREEIRKLPDPEREQALQQLCQDVLGLTVASLMALPTIVTSTAVGSEDGGGYHLLLYAHITDQPKQVLGGLIGALRPFLVEDIGEHSIMSLGRDGEMTAATPIP